MEQQRVEINGSGGGGWRVQHERGEGKDEVV